MITKVNIKGEFETLRKSIEQQPIVRYDILFHQLLFKRYVPKKTPALYAKGDTLQLYTESIRWPLDGALCSYTVDA